MKLIALICLMCLVLCVIFGLVSFFTRREDDISSFSGIVALLFGAVGIVLWVAVSACDTIAL